jgi:hypothetical protein
LLKGRQAIEPALLGSEATVAPIAEHAAAMARDASARTRTLE